MKETETPPQAPKPPAQQQGLQIEIDEAVANGAYSNLAVITHTETEFLLDFMFIQQGQPKAKVRSRIVASPLHARRVLMALHDNIQKYEARFGPIEPKRDKAIGTA